MQQTRILIATVFVLSGCSTVLFESDTNRLRTAVESDNVENVEQVVNDGLTYSPMSEDFDDFRQAQDDAVRMLSEHYLEDYVEQAGGRVSLNEFDAYCRQRMPNFSSSQSVGGRICSNEARLEIQQVELVERERERQAEAEKRQEADNQIRAEIDRGEREITTIREARAYFQPIESESLLTSPAVNGGDGQYYQFRTPLTDKYEGTYLSWWPDAAINLRAGALIVEPVFIEDGIRFGEDIIVIGEYVRNESISLASGTQATIPVFENSYIFK